MVKKTKELWSVYTSPNMNLHVNTPQTFLCNPPTPRHLHYSEAHRIWYDEPEICGAKQILVGHQGCVLVPTFSCCVRGVPTSSRSNPRYATEPSHEQHSNSIPHWLLQSKHTTDIHVSSLIFIWKVHKVAHSNKAVYGKLWSISTFYILPFFLRWTYDINIGYKFDITI